MKYSEHERINIGRQIYDGEMTCRQAAELYNLSLQCTKQYLKKYRVLNGLPPKREKVEDASIIRAKSTVSTLEDYESMSKEELIQELVRAKINEERAKKGYIVKGVGAQKGYILLDNRNTKS